MCQFLTFLGLTDEVAQVGHEQQRCRSTLWHQQVADLVFIKITDLERPSSILGAKPYLNMTSTSSYCLLQVYQTSTGLDRSFTRSVSGLWQQPWNNTLNVNSPIIGATATASITRDMNSFPSVSIREEGKIGKKGVGGLSPVASLLRI